MSAALDTQPAARKAALLRTLESTLINLSPTPSLIDDRYAVRSWYKTKLQRLARADSLGVVDGLLFVLKERHDGGFRVS